MIYDEFKKETNVQRRRDLTLAGADSGEEMIERVWETLQRKYRIIVFPFLIIPFISLALWIFYSTIYKGDVLPGIIVIISIPFFILNSFFQSINKLIFYSSECCKKNIELSSVDFFLTILSPVTGFIQHLIPLSIFLMIFFLLGGIPNLVSIIILFILLNIVLEIVLGIHYSSFLSTPQHLIETINKNYPYREE